MQKKNKTYLTDKEATGTFKKLLDKSFLGFFLLNKSLGLVLVQFTKPFRWPIKHFLSSLKFKSRIPPRRRRSSSSQRLVRDIMYSAFALFIPNGFTNALQAIQDICDAGPTL